MTIILLFTTIVGYGQDKSEPALWMTDEINLCEQALIADIDNDITALNILSNAGVSKESYAKCGCNSLKEKYDSYDLARTDLENKDECQIRSLFLNCYFGFDIKKLTAEDDNARCVLGDCFCDFGKLVFKNGEIYEGTFFMGLYQGNGTFLYENGDRFEGEFIENLKHRGSFYFSNGDTYTGEFQDNTYHGLGLMKYNNGEIYYGDFKHGYKHGIGTYTYANGAKHSGSYANDLPHGEGELTHSDGKLIGSWVSGMKHGKFIFRVLGEKDIEVYYDYDKEIE